jgi:crossover junction endodeoxyribonuclease RuvC
MLIIGVDPGLTCTGWGIVAKAGSRLSHIANGQIRTDTALSMAERLVELDAALTDVILRHTPDSGAVEEVFVNVNPQSTLKLGQARGVAMLSLARAGLPVAEYPTKVVKKGAGRHGRRGQGAGPGHAESAAARREAGRRRRGRRAGGGDHPRQHAGQPSLGGSGARVARHPSTGSG